MHCVSLTAGPVSLWTPGGHLGDTWGTPGGDTWGTPTTLSERGLGYRRHHLSAELSALVLCDPATQTTHCVVDGCLQPLKVKTGQNQTESQDGATGMMMMMMMIHRFFTCPLYPRRSSEDNVLTWCVSSLSSDIFSRGQTFVGPRLQTAEATTSQNQRVAQKTRRSSQTHNRSCSLGGCQRLTGPKRKLAANISKINQQLLSLIPL